MREIHVERADPSSTSYEFGVEWQRLFAHIESVHRWPAFGVTLMLMPKPLLLIDVGWRRFGIGWFVGADGQDEPCPDCDGTGRTP